MPVKEKTLRNKILYDIWKKEKLSYKQLGEIFRIDVRAAFRIVKREKEKELIDKKLINT